MMKRLAYLLLAATVPGPATALTPEALTDKGYGTIACLFREHCVIGVPCKRAWRELTWYHNDAEGQAYQDYGDGRLRRGMLMPDQRWKSTSQARAIVMPMREAVAGHLTVFDDGGAVYSMQYAGNPGSGHFLLGRCEISEGASAE